MEITRNIKILWEQGGVKQGEIEIFSNYTNNYEKFGIVFVYDEECLVDFTLYEYDTDKEVTLSHKERKLILEELKQC